MIKLRIYTIGYLILSTLLSVIRRLQKTNETVQKHLADVHAQTKLRMLICQIRQSASIDYDRFNEVYTDFVEKKRQRMLNDINRINSQFMKSLRERQEAELPMKGFQQKRR